MDDYFPWFNDTNAPTVDDLIFNDNFYKNESNDLIFIESQNITTATSNNEKVQPIHPNEIALYDCPLISCPKRSFIPNNCGRELPILPEQIKIISHCYYDLVNPHHVKDLRKERRMKDGEYLYYNKTRKSNIVIPEIKMTKEVELISSGKYTHTRITKEHTLDNGFKLVAIYNNYQIDTTVFGIFLDNYKINKPKNIKQTFMKNKISKEYVEDGKKIYETLRMIKVESVMLSFLICRYFL